MPIYYIHSEKPLSAPAREKLEGINARLQRFFRSVISVSWTFARQRDTWRANCQVHGRSGHYRAVAQADTARAAMDEIYERLVRQRRRARRKVLAKRRRVSAPEA
ncbi:MAG: HPF/RaiA family ribosome-associated protein [Gammaproteobacteria bacterium]